MNWFGAKSKRNEVIGVEFSTDGVAFAHIKRTATQQPFLNHSEFIPSDDLSQAADSLRNRLAKLGLQKVPCNIVMSNGTYQMLLGEAPKVPPEELGEALRWRVKDLIQFPIADAVLDAFLLPEDSARGANRMAYAVVAQRNNVIQLVSQAKAAQLDLQSIDIPELALRNLAQSCYDTKRGIALVKLAQGGGSLQIIRDGNVYLSRQFSLAYNAGLLDDLPADALVLELQRSLDYFERQMRQTPPSHIYICGENVTGDKLTPEIRNSMAVKIELFNIESGLQLGADVQEHSLSLCLLALGAALREDAVGAA
ncbi:MAG: MSHA biogenesis protein MshI [Gammaproteobacteria bacterium]|nr:MAG: MSHA biogenesis protein MshI [Gammaproteobacteria bacterium]